MKFRYIIILLLFSSAYCVAQDLSFLDENNGYKEYKFGKSPNELINIEKPDDWNDEFYTSQNIVPYNYNGSNINTFLNSPVYNVDFWFFKDKLFGIGFTLGVLREDFSLREFGELKNYLTEIFGTEYHLGKSKPGIVKCYIWKGKKVTLEITLSDFDYDLPEEERRPTVCYMYMYENELNTEMKKSQF